MPAINLRKIYSDRVRDLYEIDDKRVLMVTSDRLSAFDVILDNLVPGEGGILTQISNLWFRKLAHIMPNHFAGDTVYDVLPKSKAMTLKKRVVMVKKLTPVKVKATMRGYLAGSDWEDYRETGVVYDIKLPGGLQGSQQLPEAVSTPSAKATVGNHDENISFKECERIIGEELAAEVRAKAVRLYTEAAEYAKSRGVVICDTEFKFGVDENGTSTLMDEALAPDSSRFWPANQCQVGANPPSFDKQFVRDWLEQSGRNKQVPAPKVPADIIQKTIDKYRGALHLLTQD